MCYDCLGVVMLHMLCGGEECGSRRVSVSRSLSAEGTELAADREGSLDGLLVVEAGVAPRLVVVLEHVFGDTRGATRALGHRLLAGHLEVDSCEHRARLTVHLESGRHLSHHVVEVAGLEARRLGRHRVAVYAVALPNDRDASGLHGLDVPREVVSHLVLAIAGDQHHLALLLVGVEHAHEVRELIVLHGRAHLAADGVGKSTEVLHVAAEELARAVPDPHQVRTKVVVLVAHLAGQRLLEVELHGLVGGEETARLGGHQVLLDPVGDSGALRVVRGCGQETDIDGLDHGAHVARLLQAAEIVESRSRVEVARQEALGIPLALRRLVAVDVIALERHDLAVALQNLGGLGTRLAVLASDASNAHGGRTRGLRDDGTHLQHELELRL
mmetsp:Transcript_8875/g.24511  ORF Transcript_8875/g.24511 Transcript_8875/m.24511 type:complete len:386 (-) Transcript_8875:310-1467(-)